MNPAKYNSLPADLRALIDQTVGPQAAEKCGKLFDQAEIEGKQKFISKGIEIIVLPPDEVARMKKLFAAADRGGDRRCREAGKAGPQILRGLHEVAEVTCCCAAATRSSTTAKKFVERKMRSPSRRG